MTQRSQHACNPIMGKALGKKSADQVKSGIRSRDRSWHLRRLSWLCHRSWVAKRDRWWHVHRLPCRLRSWHVGHARVSHARKISGRQCSITRLTRSRKHGMRRGRSRGRDLGDSQLYRRRGYRRSYGRGGSSGSRAGITLSRIRIQAGKIREGLQDGVGHCGGRCSRRGRSGLRL